MRQASARSALQLQSLTLEAWVQLDSTMLAPLGTGRYAVIAGNAYSYVSQVHF